MVNAVLPDGQQIEVVETVIAHENEDQQFRLRYPIVPTETLFLPIDFSLDNGETFPWQEMCHDIIDVIYPDGEGCDRDDAPYTKWSMYTDAYNNTVTGMTDAHLKIFYDDFDNSMKRFLDIIGYLHPHTENK